MNHILFMVPVVALCAIVPTAFTFQQLANWGAPQPAPAQAQVIPQQFAPGSEATLAQRAPIPAELHNQVNALSAQLAAANRQIQYYQQQLSLAAAAGQQPQQQPQLGIQQQLQQQQLASQLQQPGQLQQPLNESPAQHHQHSQAHLAHQQLVAGQPQAVPFHQHQQAPQFLSQHQQIALQQQQQAALEAQQQAPQQPQQQPAPISTLVDNTATDNQQHLSAGGANPRLAGQPTQLYYQQDQQSQQVVAQAQAEPARANPFLGIQQQVPTSTTMGPLTLEQPSLDQSVQQQQQQPQPTQPQAPTDTTANVHNAPRNDDKFSIGLGVLSPGYTQKFGNTALDFNQDKNGFSFTLSNNGHNNQPQPTPKGSPAATTGAQPAA